MQRFSRRSILFIMPALALATLALSSVDMRGARGQGHEQFLRGRIVAIGIPGVSAVSPVGTFLPGGPIHDNPLFAAYTKPGKVIDPTRLLVGSTSNFGAPLARHDQLPGSFLSIGAERVRADL
jgi:hypothetical protein